MDSDQLDNFLRTVPLFHTLDPEMLRQVGEQIELREVTTDQIVLQQGEVSTELFILLQGEAAAFATEKHSSFSRKLRHFYPGEYFGLMNTLTEEHSPAEVRTLEPCKFIIISRMTMERLFQEVASFGKSVCKSLAYHLHDNIVSIPAIPFERLDTYSNLTQTAELLPKRISQYFQAIAVEQKNDRVKVGMVDPSDHKACEFIREVLSPREVEIVAISEEDFNHYAPAGMGASVSTVDSATPFAELFVVDSAGQRVSIDEVADHGVLARTLSTAIRAGVSDIHIEPADQGGRIRFRLDGRLFDFDEQVSLPALKQIISRLKVMAALDITNVRTPQDGRILLMADDRTVEFRESIMPCHGGEKAVLRVISTDHHLKSTDSLFASRPVSIFARDILSQPGGLVLVTGPTGSGKTTTLYAALHMLNADDGSRNIVTVEDPIEYGLPFATQIQVDNTNRLGFGRILRSVLRQDPDIILVGEIRDQESAAIAVEAAATGHLVLSSLHTHSTLETLARLRNLEIPSYLLADALKGVISQKLVPRLHPSTSEPVPEGDETVERLRQLGVFNGEIPSTLRRAQAANDAARQERSGRVALFELLAVNESLSELIEREATRADMASSLDDEIFFSFHDYARLLLVEGLVAPEQIERVLPKRASLNRHSLR